MARNPIESKGWKPEETDSSVISEIESVSAIERVARRVTMGTDVKRIPRSGEVDVDVVPKGSAYGEDVHEYDDVTLVAKKLGRMVRLAEEDLDDSPLPIIEQKKKEWASSYARYLDNACLAVTGAVGAGVPFTSVYRALSTTNAATGYVAGANIVKIAASGDGVDYEALSDALAEREGSVWYDPSKEIAIAATSFKSVLRKLKSPGGDYIFQTDPTAAGAQKILDVPVEWSQGARLSATATNKPTGNPIMVFGNRDHLILGVRSGPESVVIDGRDGTSATTDETLLKMRARRAFTIGHEDAFYIIELDLAA